MEKADDVIISESSENIPSAEKTAENGGVVHEEAAVVVGTNTGSAHGNQDLSSERSDAAEPEPVPAAAETPVKRKVSFPEDNCLVSRTYDPVDPWRNGE